MGVVCPAELMDNAANVKIATEAKKKNYHRIICHIVSSPREEMTTQNAGYARRIT